MEVTCLLEGVGEKWRLFCCCFFLCRALERRREEEPGFNLTLDDFEYFNETLVSTMISDFMLNVSFTGVSVSLNIKQPTLFQVNFVGKSNLGIHIMHCYNCRWYLGIHTGGRETGTPPSPPLSKISPPPPPPLLNQHWYLLHESEWHEIFTSHRRVKI